MPRGSVGFMAQAAAGAQMAMETIRVCVIRACLFTKLLRLELCIEGACGEGHSLSGGREKKIGSWETLGGGRLLEEGGAGQRAQARYGPTIVPWLATAGLEAWSWEGRSQIREVRAGVGRKEVEPGGLFQGAELGGAESRHNSPRGWGIKWEGQV